METIFDVIVIGGGPGGIVAARTLAEGGKKTALVEDAQLGGTCMNQGCIPTKFWLAATALLGSLRDQKRYGVLTGEIGVDFEALQKRKDRFIKGSSQAVGKTLQAAGVTVMPGRAAGRDRGVVEVVGENTVTIKAENIILATGSHSAVYPGLEPDGRRVLDSTMALALEEIPQSLLIVGAGAIGIEFSDFFAAMGSEVTVVEGMPRIVPIEDADIAEELRKTLAKSGRRCVTGRKVKSVTAGDGQAELMFEDGETLTAEKALIAVGRRANTHGLGVEALGGSLDARGFVKVDAELRTGPDCYAVGDVNGLALLAHPAEHQGAWVARHILGEEKGAYDSGPVPACIFGHTEVMRVGMTAREAASQSAGVKVSKALFSVNPIAQAHGASNGFAKAVWADGRLVGMAAIGHDASHLVTAAQLLVLSGQTPESLHRFMFAHPTLDEILKSAITAPRQVFTA